MAAIRTQRVGCDNATLALGRQLMAYVLAADFAELAGTPDVHVPVLAHDDPHGRSSAGTAIWNSLYRTHIRSATNWGAYAGASRIAASLYLGDTRRRRRRRAAITQGFLGNRTAYRFSDRLTLGGQVVVLRADATTRRSTAAADAAASSSTARSSPTSAAAVSLAGRPATTGVQYQLDSIQGMGMQVELLYQNGYTSAWHGPTGRSSGWRCS